MNTALNKLSLYQIQDQYRDIVERLEQAVLADELDAEQIDSLNAELAINQADFTNKVDAYAAVIGQKEARVAYLQSEIRRLQVLAKAEKAVADRLKDRISAAMVEQGLSKADTPHYRLSFRSSTAVDVQVPVEKLPALYQRTKLVHEPDKEAIKSALKSGLTVPGAVLVERQSLQIR